MATSLGACADLGRSEQQGEARSRRGVGGGRAGRPARGARRGQDFEAASVGTWPREGAASGRGRWARMLRGRAPARGGAGRGALALWSAGDVATDVFSFGLALFD
jgi:hypothetical protein